MRGMPIDAETAEAAEAAPVRPASRTARTGFLARLFVLVLVAMLPALAIQAYNEIAGREFREAEVREDALRLAQFASGELDRIVENGRAVLAALANLPAARDLDGVNCSDYVASLQRSLSAICLDRRDRPVRTSLLFKHRHSGGFDRRRPGVLSKGQGHRPLHGRPVPDRAQKKSVLPMGLPFFDRSNHTAGVVYVSLDLNWLARYFAETRPFSQKTALVITDRDGTILARIPDNSSYAGKSFRPEFSAELDAQKPGTADIVAVDGKVRIVGFVPASASPSGL